MLAVITFCRRDKFIELFNIFIASVNRFPRVVAINLIKISHGAKWTPIPMTNHDDHLGQSEIVRVVGNVKFIV